MPNDDNYFSTTGTVTSALGNSMFKVFLSQENQEIICTLSGKIRKNNIRITEGDSVIVDVSIFDTSRGRITFRNKK